MKHQHSYVENRSKTTLVCSCGRFKNLVTKNNPAVKEKSYVDDVNAGRAAIMRDIETMQTSLDPDYSTDERYREPLCVDTYIEKKILLSTDGPEDGFKLYFSKMDDGKYDLSHGVYYRADWGTYKEASLSDDEAQTVFDFYLGGYIPEMEEK